MNCLKVTTSCKTKRFVREHYIRLHGALLAGLAAAIATPYMADASPPVWELGRSVVLVESPLGESTGFVVATVPDKTLILTTAHSLGCDSGASSCSTPVKVFDWHGSSYQAIPSPVGIDAPDDIAILVIGGSPLSALPLSKIGVLGVQQAASPTISPSASLVGSEAFLIYYSPAEALLGGTQNRAPLYDEGVVSTVLGNDAYFGLSVNPPGPGAAGAPVIDQFGTVVGVFNSVKASIPIALNSPKVCTFWSSRPDFLSSAKVTSPSNGC